MTKEQIKGIMSHKKDDWATPTEVYEELMKHCIDPCPLFSKEDNLNKIYHGENIFINPPYSQIDKWVEFIENNYEYNKKIILLIPSRTDTKYFERLMKLKPIIYFINGRLRFNNEKPAPFPSMIMLISKCVWFSCVKVVKNKLLVEQIKDIFKNEY